MFHHLLRLTQSESLIQSDVLIGYLTIHSNQIKNFTNLQDLNFLIQNILKISNEESIEMIRQSIPEKNPILYTEKILKIL